LAAGDGDPASAWPGGRPDVALPEKWRRGQRGRRRRGDCCREGKRNPALPQRGRKKVMRLTMAQALVRFLSAQYVERDGIEHRFFEGCFGIFGHGNLTGVGQALAQDPDLLTYYQARNEQAMVHTAAGFARMRNRLGTLACTTSIGPGATNMVTGAAAATVNRVPVLLL